MIFVIISLHLSYYILGLNLLIFHSIICYFMTFSFKSGFWWLLYLSMFLVFFFKPLIDNQMIMLKIILNVKLRHQVRVIFVGGLSKSFIVGTLLLFRAIFFLFCQIPKALLMRLIGQALDEPVYLLGLFMNDFFHSYLFLSIFCHFLFGS